MCSAWQLAPVTPCNNTRNKYTPRMLIPIIGATMLRFFSRPCWKNVCVLYTTMVIRTSGMTLGIINWRLTDDSCERDTSSISSQQNIMCDDFTTFIFIFLSSRNHTSEWNWEKLYFVFWLILDQPVQLEIVSKPVMSEFNSSFQLPTCLIVCEPVLSTLSVCQSTLLSSFHPSSPVLSSVIVHDT